MIETILAINTNTITIIISIILHLHLHHHHHHHPSSSPSWSSSSWSSSSDHQDQNLQQHDCITIHLNAPQHHTSRVDSVAPSALMAPSSSINSSKKSSIAIWAITTPGQLHNKMFNFWLLVAGPSKFPWFLKKNISKIAAAKWNLLS